MPDSTEHDSNFHRAGSVRSRGETPPATDTGMAPSDTYRHATTGRLQVWAEYLLLAFLLGIFLFRSFLPAWYSLNTDFRNYYVAARLYREGSSLLRVYDFTWFQRQKDHQGIQQCLVGFVPDTLLSALPIVPFAGFPPLTAKRCWLAINAVILALSALVLTQITQLGWRRILIVIFLAIEPLGKSFLYGQMHLLVFFLLAVAVWCSERDRPAAAGISVALAAALKLYPALLLAFFLRKKQWRAAAATVVGLVALAGLSVYLFGWDVHRIYLREILPAIGRGENIDPYSPQWNSLTALLHRAFIAEPELNPHPLFNAPYLYALLQPLCQAAIFVPAVWLLLPRSLPRPQERLEWAMFAAMLMALSTGPTPYHLCILILTAALGLDALLAQGRRKQACGLLILYGVTCFPLMLWAPHNADAWHMLIASPRVYPLVGLAFYFYGTTFGLPLVREWLRAHRRETWAFGLLFLLLGAVGVVQAVRHERGLFDSYSHRIFTVPGSLLRGEPAVGANGLFVTRMPGNNPAFETWLWSKGQFTPLLPAEDEFHPASAPSLKEVWIEQAGPVSNIVRLSNFDRPGGPTSQIEVANGEQPSVSPDGKWLVFVRENRGRGELWLNRLAPGDNVRGGPQSKLVDDTYDVWEAAFEPGDRRIIFTAAAHGQPDLYSLDMASGRITSMPITGPARYPAFSPDGKWLAYTRCEQGNWHLYVTRPGSASGRQLTSGEYNAISPVWEGDSKSLIYATDDRRGLNMTALARMTLPSDF